MTRHALLLVAALTLAACKGELVCPEGQTACDDACVSLLTDSRHCGACGRAVGPLETCSAGAPACRAEMATCGGACTDLAHDPASCGACGAACPAGELCRTVGGETACTATCAAPLAACGGACVDPQWDAQHCGACGHACAAGEACRAGACRADVQVACYATSEVVPVTAALAPAGAPRPTPAGPTSLAILGSAVYAVTGYPAANLSVLPLDPALPARDVALTGIDLEDVVAHEGALLVANAYVGSLVVAAPSGDVLDELAMPRQQDGPNPRAVAVAGSAAYLPLYGNGRGAWSGQSIGKVSLSGLAACLAGTSASCGTAEGEIPLGGVAGSASPGALPFPADAVAHGAKVYVALANLGEDTISCGQDCTYTGYVKPAGNGRLAIVDTAAADAVSVLELPGCGNPGALALSGTTLWVSCGSYSYPTLAPSLLLPVNLAVSPPAPGTALALAGIVPGRLAFCGAVGYVTDQASGAVVRFDPATRAVDAPVVVCPNAAAGWAWAADVACAP